MKNLLSSKYSLCFLALVWGFALAPRYTYGGANEVTPDGQHILRWPAGSSVHYVVNPSGVPGFTTALQQQVVTGAVDDAFRAWTNISGASIHFSDDGGTSQSGASADGVNVVSFLDPNQTVSFPPGVLAFTVITSAPAAGNIQLANGKVVTAQFVGQILDADIVFNSQIAFSPIGTTNNDIVAIGRHEAGHLLGLDHTGVLSSIMNPFAESGLGAASRDLQSDDMISATSIYPDPSFSPVPGTISGTITSSTGAPIKSADVVVFTTDSSGLNPLVPVASQLSGADGSYRITGLPPGKYMVGEEPLDGPITLRNFPGFYSSGQTNFATTLFGGTATPTTVSVAAGQASTVPPIVAPAAPSNLLNILQMASVFCPQGVCPQAANFTFSSSPLYLPRGNTYQVLMTGTSGSSNDLGSGSNIFVGSSGAEITPQGGTSGGTFSSGQPYRQQNISINSTATPGPRNMGIANSSSISAMPGGVVVTVNPSFPVAGVVNSASNSTVLAPGTIFSLYGTDVVASYDHVSAVPLPTNLGGISVKVGNRYAPLFSTTCPNGLPLSTCPYFQINGMIPFETTGASTTMTVIAGPNAASSTVTIPLNPTAPGIFSLDLSGAGQGAILNADYSIVDARHPAVAGRDVILIYASGLGPVTPSLPSGAASQVIGNSFPQLVRLPQVLIGGVPVPQDSNNIPFAGLAPGFVGLYQVNVAVPANVAGGSQVSVQIVTAEGQRSNTVTIAVTGGGNNPVVLTGTAASVSGTVPGTAPFDSTATGSISVSATGTSSGGQTVYIGGGSGSGTALCSDNGGTGTGTGNWTGTISAFSMTVNPAITSLTTNGGTVSGSFSLSFSDTLCGQSQTQSVTGTVTGTVNPGGAVTLSIKGSGGN